MASLLAFAVPGQFKGTTLDENYTVNPGDDIVLNCEVMGKPMPPITWNFYRGDSKSNPKLMNRTFPNGSILIDDVQNEDIGRYLCIFYLRESNPQVKSYTLNVRQLEGTTDSESSSDENEVCKLTTSTHPKFLFYFLYEFCLFHQCSMHSGAGRECVHCHCNSRSGCCFPCSSHPPVCLSAVSLLLL